MTYRSNLVSDCIDDNEKCAKWMKKDWFSTWCDNRKPHSYFGNIPLSSACPSCCDGTYSVGKMFLIISKLIPLYVESFKIS